MKRNEVQNVYLQPECNVIEVLIEQMIAVSENKSNTESLTEEDFEW